MDSRQLLLILCFIESSVSRRSGSAVYPAAGWTEESSSCCRILLDLADDALEKHAQDVCGGLSSLLVARIAV
jgi:hypothetical protein